VPDPADSQPARISGADNVTSGPATVRGHFYGQANAQDEEEGPAGSCPGLPTWTGL